MNAKDYIKKEEEIIPQKIMELVGQREELRKKKRFHLADQMRNKIKNLGYDVQDTNGETKVKKIPV